MKTKITQREIKNNFSKIICIGYCDAQYLLNYISPNRYNAGVYGWNFDAYDLGGGVCVVTGYRPFGNARVPYDELRKLEKKACSIQYDHKIDWRKKHAMMQKLIKRMISLAE